MPDIACPMPSKPSRCEEETARPERRDAGENHVRPDGRQRVVVEPKRLQPRVRQVRHDHVGPRHQALEHMPPLRRPRVEGHAPLAAVDLQVEGPVAGRGHRHEKAVFPAPHFLDPNHVGPEVGEQRRAATGRR